MIRHMVSLAIGLGLALPAAAGSLTLGGLLDADDGASVDLGGRFAVTEAWSLGAGVGHSESKIDGQEFSGSSLSASTDLDLGAFFANASASRWKDSGQLRNTVLRGEVGWMGASGLALSVLLTDRAMRVDYTTTVLGQQREREIDIDGTGLGAAVSYFGTAWSAGLRYLDYDYGHSVERVRAVLESADTGRFPLLQRLIGSVATRAAAAPDREASLMLGRQFARHSLTGDWQWQRDALTGEESQSLGLTLGWDVTRRFTVDTTVGVTDSDAAGTVPWGGLALTLRSVK
jgi:hypothetical protein